jgi:hypothetical protein
MTPKPDYTADQLAVSLEVYRARDTKLDRDGALKVLPQAFTGGHADTDWRVDHEPALS